VRVTIRVDHRTGKLGGRSPTILHFYCWLTRFPQGEFRNLTFCFQEVLP
jgi:hypothetical protein